VDQIFGEKRLLEASKCSADLKAFVEQQQIRIVDKLVGRHDSKSAFKLFRHFELQESDCPGLRGLCEEKSLSWHVSAGHYDILEGRLERRYGIRGRLLCQLCGLFSFWVFRV